MSTFLLDVNVLIALVDPAHVQHEHTHDWFERRGRDHFATCPITENGLLRIVGHPKYPNSPGPPSAVVSALRAMRAMEGHVFWPDQLSLVASDLVDVTKLSAHASITDYYLLALAASNGGQLATLDRRLAFEAVAGGKQALELI